MSVLSDVSLSFAPGDAAAIMGPSGSGKSTLLYILGALEPPTTGTVTLGGVNPFGLSAEGSRGVPQQGNRLRVPGPLPAAAMQRARERARADARRTGRCRQRRARTSAGRSGRAVASHDASAGSAVGRREAACRAGPRARSPSAAAAVRRADGQSRSRIGRLGRVAAVRAAAAAEGHARSSSRTAPISPRGFPSASISSIGSCSVWPNLR